MMKLSQIAAAVDGQLLGTDVDVNQFNTDTRTIKTGDLFIALSGARFDANDFVPAAVEAGASAALVSRYNPALVIPQVVVADTQKALGLLAKAWREQFALVRVAMTGSSGKTTTKELTASIFRQAGQTLATLGNKNNEIGVPLTLLRLSAQDQYGVFELGANHKGEIAYTSGLVQPHAALITNIGTAHLEGFGSRQGIAEAKGEIFSSLTAEGIAVINKDDDFAAYHQQLNQGRRIITFSTRQAADITACDSRRLAAGNWSFTLVTPLGTAPVTLRLLGEHNIANALAATGLALACGLSLAQIQHGLEQAEPAAGRMVLHQHGDLAVIDDTYNANPTSMQAAIDMLSGCQGRRIAILGAMGELGTDAAELHASVGAYAHDRIDALYCVGAFSQQTAAAAGAIARHFPDQASLFAELDSLITAPATVLVKGSRSARMELVVQQLLKEHS